MAHLRDLGLRRRSQERFASSTALALRWGQSERTPSGFGWARRRNFREGLLFSVWRRVPAHRKLGGGRAGALRGVRGLAALLCGEGVLVCREIIERSLL